MFQGLEIDIEQRKEIKEIKLGLSPRVLFVLEPVD